MTDLLNWIDNADSYLCPKCRAEVDNPAKTEGRCPRCGFQDPRYGVMTNRRYLESLSDYDFATLLVWLSVGANVDYDLYENPVKTLYDIWIASDGKIFEDYDEAIEHEVWWLRQCKEGD